MENEFYVKGDDCYIELGKGYVTIISQEHLELVKQYKRWYPNTDKYGRTYVKAYYNDNGKPSVMQMHRLICGNPVGKIVDHKDRNTLNNRDNNLRATNNLVNRMNSKNIKYYPGVQKTPNGKRWKARISQKDLGTFDTMQEAIQVRKKAEIELWGHNPNPDR